ncbi:expressed unknown protein [Seminavis robusta]|uniref:Uncharacterized protein n=1 Tax=Seminavis robusta TaxID=568900 RepID=A0A9N8HB27_9STRA|nr:expressed unknown protein [Seminavis robusta]|eukprot:Sro246_g097780.1 n/a (538) ;mRNA; r:57046-58659
MTSGTVAVKPEEIQEENRKPISVTVKTSQREESAVPTQVFSSPPAKRPSAFRPSPVSVSSFHSTSYFDSPDFSRRQSTFKSGYSFYHQHSRSIMPVPVSSEHGQGNDGEPPSRGGYRPPPPGYGSPYPPYAAFPPGHPYGGPPPPHGYSPHHAYPPHHHSTAYSPGGGYQGRPIYGYAGSGAYEGGPGGYPMQQSRSEVGRAKTPPFQRPRGASAPPPASRPSPAAPGPPPVSVAAATASQRSSPMASSSSAAGRRDTKSSPEQQQQQPDHLPSSHHHASSSSQQPRSSPTKIADDLETERLRQAALTEISPSQVAPIKTAFHFFVMDMRDSMRPLAVEEVRRSTRAREGEPLDPYLVNANLNCRLIKAWEDVSEEARQACMTREEADRRRFMEEEEIASRHCATLTARSKSPKTPERRTSSNTNGGHLGGDSRATPNPSPTSMTTNPSPSPISRLSVEHQHNNNDDNDEKKVDDSAIPSRVVTIHDVDNKEHRLAGSPDGGGTSKRPSPTKTDEKGASPPKRNRLEEEGSMTAAAP